MNSLGKILFGVVALAVLWWAYLQVAGIDEIDFRGVKIQLTRKYVDYDAYKNDPNNIADFELPRIERMIVEAKIGHDFQDWPAFVHAVVELTVPGYGLGGGPAVNADGREFLVASVEIPTRPAVDKNRYFVLEKLPGGRLKLVDDFVSCGFLRLAEIDLREGRLIYRSKDTTVVRETPL